MPLIRNSANEGASTPALGFEQAIAGLRAPDAASRWRAARALAAFAHAAEALGQAAEAEADPQVREAMFTSLARIGTAQSVRALAPLLRSDDAAHRTGAMDALKAIPDGLPAVMAELLNDHDADVRVLACDLARQLPEGEATALLSAVLDTDMDLNVCAAAIDVIADIGSAAALPSLRRCADRFADEPFMAFAVKVASERIGAQAAPRG